MKTLSTIPLAPFLARKGEEIASGGHPQTPAIRRRRTPLWTPLFQDATKEDGLTCST